MHLNHEKAREYFSAYYEGTLERGLAEAFERAMRTDAQVQAEYRAFEHLMGALGTMKAEAPEPEFDLHEAIARRLDKHIYEETRRAKNPIFGWWKSAALGGLATVALVAAIWQLRANQSAGPGVARMIAIAATEKVELKSSSNGFDLHFSTSGEKTIVVRAADGSVLEQRELKNGSLVSPLSNPNAKAALLKIEVTGDSGETYVALPGTRMQSGPTGEGSVKELAQALAGYYRVPVLLSMGGQDVQLRWTFEPGDGLGAAEKALENTKYSVQKNADGVLAIQSN